MRELISQGNEHNATFKKHDVRKQLRGCVAPAKKKNTLGHLQIPKCGICFV